MATPTMAIQRIRRARRERAPPPATDFTRFRAEYEVLLEETDTIGGEAALDTLTEWIISRTHDHGTLPPPSDVRERAKTICRDQGKTVPDASPLQESTG